MTQALNENILPKNAGKGLSASGFLGLHAKTLVPAFSALLGLDSVPGVAVHADPLNQSALLDDRSDLGVQALCHGYHQVRGLIYQLI